MGRGGDGGPAQPQSAGDGGAELAELPAVLVRGALAQTTHRRVRRGAERLRVGVHGEEGVLQSAGGNRVLGARGVHGHRLLHYHFETEEQEAPEHPEYEHCSADSAQEQKEGENHYNAGIFLLKLRRP